MHLTFISWLELIVCLWVWISILSKNCKMRVRNIVVTKKSKLVWTGRISSQNRMIKPHQLADYSQLVKVLSEFIIMEVYFSVANEYF